ELVELIVRYEGLCVERKSLRGGKQTKPTGDTLTEATHSKLPTHLRSKFLVGDRIAVLAGTKTTGFGSLGDGFTSINDNATVDGDGQLLKGHVKANFNEPDQLDASLTGYFDTVIIEGPGIENVWNTQMFATALRILKPGGRLDVTVYEDYLIPNKFGL